jgi:hypothetical protein
MYYCGRGPQYRELGYLCPEEGEEDAFDKWISDRVERDYAEAYFWFNLAITGKPKTGKLSWRLKRQAAKYRADAASHLTEKVLLKKRERGRRWAESHPAKRDTQ